MSLYLRVVEPSEIEEICDYENQKLMESIPDDSERQLKSWNARWRRESLEHYLQMGWSFLARDTDTKSDRHPEGELVGYFIAQPLLFFDGYTQSLWVEHVAYSTLKSRDELCELAYKLAREKHLQKVFFPQSSALQNCLTAFRAETWKPNVLSVRSTKMES